MQVDCSVGVFLSQKTILCTRICFILRYIICVLYSILLHEYKQVSTACPGICLLDSSIYSDMPCLYLGIPGCGKVLGHFLKCSFLPIIFTLHTCFRHQTVGNSMGSQVVPLKFLDLIRQLSYGQNSEVCQKSAARILAMALTKYPNNCTFLAFNNS